MFETRAAHSRYTVTTVFDPQRASEADWERALACWRQRIAEDQPGEPILSDTDTRHNVRQPNPLYELHRLLAVGAQGEFIGSLNASFRHEGKPDHAAFAPFIGAWGGVLQAHRRRGVASTLLQGLLALMACQARHAFQRELEQLVQFVVFVQLVKLASEMLLVDEIATDLLMNDEVALHAVKIVFLDPIALGHTTSRLFDELLAKLMDKDIKPTRLAQHRLDVAQKAGCRCRWPPSAWTTGCPAPRPDLAAVRRLDLGKQLDVTSADAHQTAGLTKSHLVTRRVLDEPQALEVACLEFIDLRASRQLPGDDGLVPAPARQSPPTNQVLRQPRTKCQIAALSILKGRNEKAYLP